MKEVTRRDFLRIVGAGALGMVARPRMLGAFERTGGLLDDPSDVIQCFHEQATSGSTINQDIVQIMMDASIMRLTQVYNVGEAWKSVFPAITENSVIGIKVNCINRSCPTHPEVVNAIVNGLAQIEVGGGAFKKNNIIIWDRTDYELTSSGYTIYDGTDPDTARCFGSNHSGIGYDYGTALNVNGVTSYPSKVISGMADYLINAAVLKDHSQGRVTLTMKNHYGTVNNPGSLQHINGCSPAIPSLSQQIRDVITPNNIQKLFIIDSLFGIYNGGPGGSPNCNPKMIHMSRDTVAIDAQGQNIINEYRIANGRTPRDAEHIRVAAGEPYNLGTTEIDLIELNNVGVENRRGTPVRTRFDVSPHPVRGSATIAFTLPSPAPVSIDLLGPTGRSAARVFSGKLAAGDHRVGFRPRGLAAGTYLLRLRAGATSRTRRVTIVN